ncbi:MAG: N-acetylneuraminate synthase [Bacteroidia bacterium]|nr:N-acetylneuraminate synthase [Bacteroidia bacterium]
MEKVIIIAEAGVNHNGDIENAYKLIDAAVEAGVDYVKFQTFKSELLVSQEAKKADYQKENTKNSEESQLDMLKKLELNEEDHRLIIDYCKKKNINFFSTAFDLTSLEYLSSLGLELVKIPSGELTNLPYLTMASHLFEKVILSTGMATMDEINQALDVFLDSGINRDNITILHCNTEYPTPMKDVNLKAMLHIGETFKTKVGYSDHTLGIEVPIAAVALGASVIEKHFTLDRLMEGPDHSASLEPNELKQMVKSIRNVELAISGSGFKEPSESELKNIQVARKSIHLACDINEGALLKLEDLIMQRPGDGISPMLINEIIGKKIIKNLNKGTKLTWNHIR